MPDSVRKPSEIVAAHGDRVWSIVFRILGDEHDARDCYQQTFLDALSVDSSGVKNWEAMLCRIATRRAMDSLRKRYRVNEVNLSTEATFGDTAPGQRMEFEELRNDVRRVLNMLPDQQALAFWLRHVEGFTPDETAQQLRITAGHVRVLTHRAIKTLRTELQEEYLARGEAK